MKYLFAAILFAFATLPASAGCETTCYTDSAGNTHCSTHCYHW